MKMITIVISGTGEGAGNQRGGRHVRRTCGGRGPGRAQRGPGLGSPASAGAAGGQREAA
nr:hypothetical protein [Streptomyces sp. NEAU-383]